MDSNGTINNRSRLPSIAICAILLSYCTDGFFTLVLFDGRSGMDNGRQLFKLECAGLD